MRPIALILFILLLPFTILVGGMVFLFSGFPVFFTQERLGMGKKNFTIYKFRTMRDEKITLIGRLLRKTGMDELPQLINIIKDDMAFVGPRPLTQADVERLNWSGNEAAPRWSVKPGLTGPAQLLKICDADLSLKEDLQYVRKRNSWLDLTIMLKSITIPLFGKYKKVDPPRS